MANRGRPTLQKRERERARVEKQKNRQSRREETKTRRENSPPRTGDVDPDIAHITPGPQPLAEWQEDGQDTEDQEPAH